MSSARPIKRNCPVAGCNVLIEPHLAMCITHWSRLKGPFKTAIITEFRNRRGSAAHLAAIDAACRSLEAGQSAAQQRGPTTTTS